MDLIEINPRVKLKGILIEVQLSNFQRKQGSK